MTDERDRGMAVADSPLRLPKVTEQVELLLDGGVRVGGSLYLTDGVGESGARERVIDLLREPEPFLPVATNQGMRLVRKDRVVVLRVKHAEDAGLAEEEMPAADHERVTIELVSLPQAASRISGRLSWCGPTDSARLIDYVNGGVEWLPVEEERGVALVQTRYILTVNLGAQSAKISRA